MTKAKSIFETATCGRCAGSGSYSYCSMYGTMCFGCSGRGWRHTKRGAAALAYFNELRSAPVSTLKAGDMIWVDMRPAGRAGFAKIESIEPSTGYERNGEKVETVCVATKLGNVHCESSHKMIRGYSAEAKAPLIKAALAYEASLSKTGKAKAKKAALSGLNA